MKSRAKTLSRPQESRCFTDNMVIVEEAQEAQEVQEAYDYYINITLHLVLDQQPISQITSTSCPQGHQHLEQHHILLHTY